MMTNLIYDFQTLRETRQCFIQNKIDQMNFKDSKLGDGYTHIWHGEKWASPKEISTETKKKNPFSVQAQSNLRMQEKCVIVICEGKFKKLV